MTNLIIGFSGPPRSGKDTAAEFAHLLLTQRNQPITVQRMSQPLKDLAVRMLPDKRFAYEDRKDEPFNSKGVSFRKLQIELFHFGAHWLGPDWLGQDMKRRIELVSRDRPHVVILCPDFGRPEEAQVLIDAGHRVYQINLEREGTTYEGDSRVRFSLPSRTYLLQNNGTLEQLNKGVKEILSLITEEIPHA